ncbi:OmpA family protein [Mucilaginibacter sp. E4BP6]|uniref:OmpA family protein n=1 Tax=Mucilaginibacter sp. E4BP6 TaxID=2723089 RepID=UPI0015C70FFF|nr:OmpA family protein [Mucilaginibacter sp. E4BP6]NYE67388.1 outer membrane protein OmpA-like peptidoglycan-associated protein [Mucilaginibacter sp. E4BP6]
MLPINKIASRLITCLLIILASFTAKAQTTQSPWWFGVSGAANLNWYDGTTQRLNNSLIVPTAFHKGFSVRPYGSILAEYRPTGILGFMLNVGYDGRGGKFNQVEAPCNCPANLQTSLSYLTVEPSLRLGVPSSGLYFFAGPRVAFDISKGFDYTQLRQPNTNSQLSAVHNTILSGQVGIGYDIIVSAPASTTKVSLSPFVSYQPYFGQEPRDIESWSITTVRAGIALKFGKVRNKAIVKDLPMIISPAVDVSFFVTAPTAPPLSRQVSETLPLLSSVFFDDGSNQIPARYVVLSADNAGSFKEAQLQNVQYEDMTGRSARQLNVYYNLLNILGDRLRANPNARVLLSGASGTDVANGKIMAEAVKLYLVNTFGIDGSRIQTEGRIKPVIPSEQPGGTKQLVLLRAGDRRVDIESASPELLFEVGGDMMKPVQITTIQTDPLGDQVVFKVDSANIILKNWSVDVTDEKGTTQHFGPFTDNQEGIPGKTILGNDGTGTFKVVMTGETKAGNPIKKESTVYLVKQDATVEKGLRYSILFNFDQSNAVAPYSGFLTRLVATSIPDGSTVIIHGHTDIIGQDDHNLKLSQQRAQDVKDILQKALISAGKNNVKFETNGFGDDVNHAPFENNTAEERSYNRTVIIDIVPLK